jgi:CheY-like chemotaxis protein
MPTVLIADPSDILRRMIRSFLEVRQYQVLVTCSISFQTDGS